MQNQENIKHRNSLKLMEDVKKKKQPESQTFKGPQSLWKTYQDTLVILFLSLD